MTKENKAKVKEPSIEESLTDEEELGRAIEEREEMGRKMVEAQAKRSKSKDPAQRIRLRSLAEDLEEAILAKEIEMGEIAGRLREAEREEARARAEELHEEAQKDLADGWRQIRRCTGYLKTLWTEWPEIWALAVRFRGQRDEYEQMCQKFGFEPKRLEYKGRDDITQWSGRGLQNPRDTLHKQDHWEAWLRDMTSYGRDQIDGMAHTPNKEKWPEYQIG